MRRIFYDFEFEENAETIIPISLGMVDDQDGELYLINADYMMQYERGYHEPVVTAKKFLEKNVLNQIKNDSYRFSHEFGLDFWPKAILDFVSQNGYYKSRNQIELWGYYGSYDHVCLAQRFGPMVYLPEPIPMFTCETKQIQSNQQLPPRPLAWPEHHSLFDAKYQKLVWETWNDQ